MKVEEFFRADKDGVAFCTTKVEKVYTYDEFILRLQSKRMSSPILPHGTIWFDANESEKLHAIQIPPKRRNIPYYDKYYEIGFPSLVLLVKTSGSYVVNVALCVAKKPITDFDEPLFRLPLPNMDDRGILCLGFNFDTQGAKYNTEVERIRAVAEYVETSKYNDHLLPLTNWVPKEILPPHYKFGDQYEGEESVAIAKTHYHDILKLWSKATEGTDWFKAVDKIKWAEFKTFSTFVRGSI